MEKIPLTDEIYTRHEVIEGIDEWVWLKQDTGAWDGPKDDWIQSHAQKYFEHVRDYKVCVCAGGNQGMYPRLFSKRFAAVYTFEPDHKNFACLAQNTAVPNVYAYRAVLGDVSRMVALHRPCDSNTGMHNVDATTMDGTIPQFRLDDFPLPALDLLQLDVEGYESVVLKGAVNTITKFKPVIVLERPNSETDAVIFPLGYKYADKSMMDTIFIPG